MKKAYYFELRKYAFGCPDCEHINEIDVDPAENGQIICEKCGETFQAEEDKNAASTGKSRRRGPSKEHKINRLSLLLTLTAVLFFTGAVWALARDGRLDFGDGLVLVGLFLFWLLFPQ